MRRQYLRIGQSYSTQHPRRVLVLLILASYIPIFGRYDTTIDFVYIYLQRHSLIIFLGCIATVFINNCGIAVDVYEIGCMYPGALVIIAVVI